MGSLTFYADANDVWQIIEFALSKGFEIHECQSTPDEKLKSFASVEDAINEYANKAPRGLYVALWHPMMRQSAQFTKIVCTNGQVVWHTEGWGLIRIHQGWINSSSRYLDSSFISNHSVRGASRIDSYYPRLGSASDWDWKEVERLSRALRYHISNRLALSKVRSHPILPGAFNLQQEGYKLR